MKDKAAKNFAEKKYNCCQAVICAYCAECGINDEDIFKLAEGFGLGMGGLMDTCGAVTGMFMAIGIHNSAGDKADPRKTKAETYADICMAAEEFKKQCGSIYCGDIKKTVEGKQLVSCQKCVETAAEYVEKYIAQHK